MNPTSWLWLAAVPAGLAALYALHRLCLSLEERGLLYYLHKRPESSAASAFVALQQAIDPTTRHVLYVHEERRSYSEEEAAGGRDDAGAVAAGESTSE